METEYATVPVNSQRLSVAVAGADGRVGREIMKALLKDDRFAASGGVIRKLDQSAQERSGDRLVKNYGSVEALLNDQTIDVLIDFTSREAGIENASAALRRGVSVVLGITGINDEEEAFLTRIALSQRCGLYVGGNLSNVFPDLLLAIDRLSSKFDEVVIWDRHHMRKHETPSDTAQELKAWFYERCDASRVEMKSVRRPYEIDEHEVHMSSQSSTLRIIYSVYDGNPFVERTLDAVVAVANHVGVIDGAEESRRWAANASANFSSIIP